MTARNPKNRKSVKRRSQRGKDKQRGNGGRCEKQFYRVFRPESEEILKLASTGATAEEIAKRLSMPTSEVEDFIGRFADLPLGLDRMLLRAPGVMGEGKKIRSMVKSAIRSRRRP